MYKTKMLTSFVAALSAVFIFTGSAEAANYKVKRGDSLSKISKTYHTTVSKIKKDNKLKSNTIRIGQILKIGKTTTVSTKTASKSVKKTKTMYVTSTSYTAYCRGCSGITRTGINLRKHPNKKVIAVDPRVIKLGSKVWVEGYGTAVAGDTGGAIKGKRIDVFHSTNKKAYAWGRKTVKIKVYL